MTTTYRASSPYHSGTGLTMNVTGECPHQHRTPEAAQRCIDSFDRAVKRGHGPNAYADRTVMVEHHGEADRHVLGARCALCDGGSR